MTTQVLDYPARPWTHRLLDALASIGDASEIGRRAAAAERLFALSDDDLVAMGLRRDRVLHHAFGPYRLL